MMGRSHAVLGATLGLGLSEPIAHVATGSSFTPTQTVSFTAVTCGASLLPDFDHPSATLAHTLGPVTKAIASGIGKVSGGHRKGTHTIWCAALLTWLVMLARLHWPAAQYAIAFCMVYVALMILRIAPGHGSGQGELVYAGESAILVALGWQLMPGTWTWLPWAVGAGVVWHIVGDCLTTQGVPIAWPLSKESVSFPILGDTDSDREHWLTFACVPLACWIGYAMWQGFPWYGDHQFWHQAIDWVKLNTRALSGGGH